MDPIGVCYHGRSSVRVYASVKRRTIMIPYIETSAQLPAKRLHHTIKFVRFFGQLLAAQSLEKWGVNRRVADMLIDVSPRC